MTKFMQFVRDDSGATAIEYGLIAALIAVVIIAAVSWWVRACPAPSSVGRRAAT
jgi:Flp pilus assembly pilin Flp